MITEAGRFANRLATEQVERWKWQLLKALVYTDPVIGPLVVPDGAVTNFASIRSLRVLATLIYALLVGYGNAACTVHDYLYEQGKFSRKECDQVLYRALRGEGVARWRALIFYIGVRLGGARHYRG